MDKILIDNIKQLPPLPESCQRIEAVYHDENSTFDDLIKILEKDPMLTADLLKAANSPLYGFSREINTLAQAVSLFGMGTVRGFALATIIKKSFKLDLSPYGIGNATFSKLSEMQHALMVNWCLRTSPKDLNLLSPAAFLTELGKVVISQCILNENRVEAFKSAMSSNAKLEEAERAICGSTTPEVGSAIFDFWKFEQDLVNVILHSEVPHNAPAHLKKFAQMLQVVRATVTLEAQITDSSLADALALIKMYGLDEKTFTVAVQKLQF
ncbi:MAG: histidine kinase [Sulfuricurvum sp. PC08-66]|nr:MAG: histidine kinase [Sulfuricurvum sp. PC08-66]